MAILVTPDLNDPDQLVEYLAEPLRAVRDAFLDGVSFADERMADMPSDSHYWAHHVRYRAAWVLRDLKPQGWKTHNPGHSAIHIERGPIVVRVLKCNGDPPHPGTNKRRKDFWEQTPNLALKWPDGTTMPDVAALILGWQIDATKNVMLELSKPVATWKYREQPALAWRRAIEFDTDDEPKFVAPMEPFNLDDVNEAEGSQDGSS